MFFLSFNIPETRFFEKAVPLLYGHGGLYEIAETGTANPRMAILGSYRISIQFRAMANQEF